MNVSIEKILLGFALCAAFAANATIIVSGDGDELCRSHEEGFNGGPYDPSCQVQEISVAPSWATNNPLGNGARWISYADTGYLGSTLGTRNMRAQATVVQIKQTFPINLGDKLNLTVWADELFHMYIGSQSGDDWTALARFGPGSLVNSEHDYDNGHPVCDDCGTTALVGKQFEYIFTPDDLLIADNDGTPNQASLFFSVFQSDLDSESTNFTAPFGLMYSGEILSGSWPPPGTQPLPGIPSALVFALGLVLLVLSIRKD